MKGERLPAEKASSLGHLEVLRSELVNKLVADFEDHGFDTISDNSLWEPTPSGGEPLSLIFGVDGSMQPVESELPPYKRLAFVKTALLRLDQYALSRIDKDSPHPLAVRDILAGSALYHATVFPLKHVSIPGLTTYHAIRQIIFDSIKDASLNAEPMETLKWIAYEKWDRKQKNLPLFECPHCEDTVATLPYDAERGQCPKCGGHLFLTDMLGFHQEMAPDSAPDTIATSYMSIHEVLLLFTGIRHYWEHRRRVLAKSLFVKDGPLSIRAQYSKLVNPIRRFLAYARNQGCDIHIIGQEKSGRFCDHLDGIVRRAPAGHLFIPGDRYIKSEVQCRPDTGAPYGKDTNFGAKVFVKVSDLHYMVLNVPTGDYVQNPRISDLIGADRIFATLSTMLSSRHEGGLLPIELAHGVASLSTYPSAQILRLFGESR
ncbi:MAG: hypothetical protein R6U93_08680 [Dehalococcoidia bacterium]